MTTTLTLNDMIRAVADAEQGARAIETVVLAFAADPTVRWLYPEAREFSGGFPEFVHAFAGRALDEGTAHYVRGFAGAAFWFAPGVHGDDEAVIAVLERTVPVERLADAFEVFEQMDDFHPKGDHWYLPLIGVDPAHQGRGHGSALLRHSLAECDRSSTPAYLESSSAANLPLYERHGFRCLGEIQAGSSPVLYPMLREPQAT